MHYFFNAPIYCIRLSNTKLKLEFGLLIHHSQVHFVCLFVWGLYSGPPVTVGRSERQWGLHYALKSLRLQMIWGRWREGVFLFLYKSILEFASLLAEVVRV